MDKGLFREGQFHGLMGARSTMYSVDRVIQSISLYHTNRCGKDKLIQRELIRTRSVFTVSERVVSYHDAGDWSRRSRSKS